MSARGSPDNASPLHSPPSSKPRYKRDEIPQIPYPYNAPVRSTSAATIGRIPNAASLRSIIKEDSLGRSIITPIAVAIGPYYRCTPPAGVFHRLEHHQQPVRHETARIIRAGHKSIPPAAASWGHRPHLQEMEDAKRAAVDEFCRVTGNPLETVAEKIASVAGAARGCYADDDLEVQDIDDGEFTGMLLLDACFLLQFMVSMCPDDPDTTTPEEDPLMSRAEVHNRIDAIVRDILLFENQIPWLVLQALIELRPAVPVDRFLALLASAFHVGNDEKLASAARSAGDGDADDDHRQPQPPHLLALFHRRQVGAARTQSLRVPRLPSLSSTAVELAEMGVMLTASRSKKFGDMAMSKRLWRGLGLGIYGELSLAPVVLNGLTECWLVNLAAYEAFLGATRADNFAVSSYIAVVALLMNKEEDVRELRAKGIVCSTHGDSGVLSFFKGLAPHLRVGHRYYSVFQSLQEYRQERWLWIPVHSFFYKHFKTIVAVLSAIGVVVGLFKTILSLKQPQ